MTQQHSQMVTDQVIQMERDKRQKATELLYYRKEQEKEKRMGDTAKRSHGLAGNPPEDTLFMKFPGEDLYKEQRTKAQQAQQQDWIAQQLAILREKEEREREEAAEYAATQRAILELKRDVELEQTTSKLTRNAETKETNQALAQDKKVRERDARSEEALRAENELNHTLSSALMTEQVPQSALGPGRIVPYAFKGMTTEQRQRILDEQKFQQDDHAARKDAVAQQERDWAAQQEEVRRAMVRAAREKQQIDLQGRLTLKDERHVQRKEQNLRQTHLAKVVYQNPVHPAFFEQFGQGCR